MDKPPANEAALLNLVYFSLKNIWDNMLWVHKDARKIPLSNTSHEYLVAASNGVNTLIKGGEKRRRR